MIYSLLDLIILSYHSRIFENAPGLKVLQGRRANALAQDLVEKFLK